MRHSIDTYVQSIAHDNRQYIVEGGYESIADYIISDAENIGWYEFFDSEEYENSDLTDEQIEELKEYLRKYYDYLP